MDSVSGPFLLLEAAFGPLILPQQYKCKLVQWTNRKNNSTLFFGSVLLQRKAPDSHGLEHTALYME